MGTVAVRKKKKSCEIKKKSKDFLVWGETPLHPKPRVPGIFLKERKRDTIQKKS